LPTDFDRVQFQKSKQDEEVDMLLRVLVVAAALTLSAGCSSYRDTSRQRMQALPQHYSQFDLRMGWATRAANGKTVVEGVVKNVRYAVMYDLEVWVAVLDAAGKVRVRSVSFVIPRQLNLDETAEFSLKLPVVVEPGTRLRFTYRYRGSEGGEGVGGGLERGTNWMQSFETVVPPK
jgi:hypothetical protein